jgi:hypothetical protein
VTFRRSLRFCNLIAQTRVRHGLGTRERVARALQRQVSAERLFATYLHQFPSPSSRSRPRSGQRESDDTGRV